MKNKRQGDSCSSKQQLKGKIATNLRKIYEFKQKRPMKSSLKKTVKIKFDKGNLQLALKGCLSVSYISGSFKECVPNAGWVGTYENNKSINRR